MKDLKVLYLEDNEDLRYTSEKRLADKVKVVDCKADHIEAMQLIDESANSGEDYDIIVSKLRTDAAGITAGVQMYQHYLHLYHNGTKKDKTPVFVFLTSSSENRTEKLLLELEIDSSKARHRRKPYHLPRIVEEFSEELENAAETPKFAVHNKPTTHIPG